MSRGRSLPTMQNPSGASAISPPPTGLAGYIRDETERLEALSYSCGVIAYYWGVRRSVEGLNHHNVFLSDEFEASWNRAARPEVRRPSSLRVPVGPGLAWVVMNPSSASSVPVRLSSIH